ncbi:uncharacterized protein RJT20DRAFT_102130 [Scheffersomyces xylosifermentans]|uniref:uncharacterized protein n=1 Tax=Scheffersomyces xylosifermentans TaxID=1304137 RepID=UPI00315D2706
MSKLSKDASQRLMNLLYKTTTPDVAPKVASVTRFLYENSVEQDSDKPTAYLDSIMENEWKQQDMAKAIKTVPKNQKRSNILKFNCLNSFITKSDFTNIYPINRDRLYKLPSTLKDGLEFEVVKARNPLNLTFLNAYYLVFPNYCQACVYYKETHNKVINGYSLHMSFVESNVSEVKNMVSPFLSSDFKEIIPKMKGEVQNETDLQNVQYRDIYRYTPNTSRSIAELLKQHEREIYSTEDFEKSEYVDPSYEVLTKLINPAARASSVLVRNLPFGLSKHTLPRLLWNYDLNLKTPVTSIVQDPVKQINIQLIRFRNPTSASRFVQNFHGRKWDSIQHHRQEKKLYDPILCEIVN